MKLQDLQKYAVKRERLERAVFVGPMELSKQVMATLHDAGWDIRERGPYTDAKMFPRVDDTRFRFVAECILS